MNVTRNLISAECLVIDLNKFNFSMISKFVKYRNYKYTINIQNISMTDTKKQLIPLFLKEKF